MRAWIVGWLVLALTVIGLTLFTAGRVAAQTTEASPSAQTASTSGLSPSFLSGSQVFLTQPAGSTFVAAGSVQQTATISGDLVVFSGSTVVSGTVTQDVYVASGTFVLEGEVYGNVVVAGGEVRFEPGSHVSGSVITASQFLRMAGNIGTDLHLMAQKAVIAGSVQGATQVQTKHLEVLASAALPTLAGQAETLDQSPEASASTEELTVQPHRAAPEKSWTTWLWLVVGGAMQGAFLAGVFWVLSRRWWPRLAAHWQTHWFRSLAWGFTAGLLWPAVAVLLLATIVGFPLTIVGTGGWLSVLWLGWVIPAGLLAQRLTQRQPSLPLWLSMLVVGAIWGGVMALPWLGWILRLFSGLTGLGVVLSVLQTGWSRAPKSS